MGGGHWDSTVYSTYATNSGLVDKHGKATNKSAHEVFKSREINQALNPYNVKIRESRDSAEHPMSNALALILDVTGSMNVVAKYIAQQALPKLMVEIYKRQPVVDPQVMFMGVDDIEDYIGGHLQVSQFESDIRIAEQLSLLWLENKGGGNDYESYSLPWYFLANHTSIDCFEKRAKKGYAISIGDELPNPHLQLDQMERVLGYRPQSKDANVLKTKSVLKKVQEKYHLIHIVAEEGSYARSNKSQVQAAWTDLLGEGNVIMMPDYTKLAEIAISAIQVAEGQDAEEVAKTWEDKDTVKIVAKATKGLKRVVEV